MLFYIFTSRKMQLSVIFSKLWSEVEEKKYKELGDVDDN